MSGKKRRRRDTPAQIPEKTTPAATIEAALNAATRHFQAGRLEQTTGLCRQILQAAPEHFGTLFLLGAVATRLGDKELAADSFAKAVAVDPANTEALVNLGIAQKHRGKPDEAMASFRRALEIDPSFAEAHNSLGKILQDQNRTLQDSTIADEALACFQRAVEIKPDFAEAHNNLGMELGNQEKLDEAVACYRRAVELNPAYADAHNNLGNVLRHQKELDEAAACYQRVIHINPNLAAAHNNLGKALKALNRLDEAAASCRRALAINPKHMDTHVTLGEILHEQQKLEEAEASYRRALEIEPDNAGTLHSLGNTLKELEKLDEAVTSFERALEIDPNAAEIHNSLGIARKQQQKLEEAVASYRRSIELWPDNAEAHNNLGNALKDQGKIDDAIACYHRAMELRANFVEAHCNLARVHTFVPGDPEIEVLKELFEREDMSTDNKTHLLFALGKAHDEIGFYAEASSYYEPANKDMAGRVNYDLSAHRNGILDIKKVFREACAGENPGGVDRVPIFVIGMSRSGKTLVESLLSQHKDVNGAGESREWTLAMKTVLDKNGITGTFPAYMDSLTDARIREIGELYLEKVSKLSPESRFLVDTMPGNYPYVGLIFQALPWAKIICCQRDPLDNFLFVYFQRYKAHHAYSYAFRSIAAYYADYQEIVAHWRKLYGDRILRVRYEELVGKPAESAARLYQHCGLEYDPAAIDIEFNTDEIGHWKNYESQLKPLRQILGKWA